MATLNAADLELLGYTEIAQLNNVAGWTVYGAKAVAGLETIEATFLYLKSDCTVEQAKEAARYISAKPNWYVITARSTKLVGTSLASIYGKDARILVHDELVWNKLAALFAEYLQSITDTIPSEKYYVPPRKDDGKPDERLDEEILSYLTGKASAQSGKLFVVCASAGVGKTTLSRQLVKQLASTAKTNHVIPIYVEASHWGKLQLGSIDQLWEIIQNSLHAFSGGLGLREPLFTHMLRQGYLAFIFDGFDELCGHKHSHFNPNEVLTNLAAIAKESDAKVVLTTRSLYWDSAISTPPANVKQLSLAPFNTQQAKGYFDKFFHSDNRLRDRAIGLYSAVIKHSHLPTTSGGTRAQFVNLPLCVVMIAEYVRSGGETLTLDSTGRLTEQLLREICGREIQRKNLLTSAERQLEAFEAIAVDDEEALNPEFELSLLEVTGIESPDLPKLVDHPLLALASNGRYRFSYDFLAPYLRALNLKRAICSQTPLTPDAWRLMVNEANGKGFVLEHLVGLLGDSRLPEVTRKIVGVPADYREAKSFLVHLARLLVELDKRLVTLQEKTVTFLSAISPDSFPSLRHVRNLTIVGPMEGLVLNGVTFRNCNFHDTSFKRCLADRHTAFEQCTFSGELEVPDADGWPDVQLADCTLLSPANLAWDKVLSKSPGNEEEFIGDALRLGLNKFWHHGRLKSSIRKDDWKKGILGHTKYCEPLLDAMLKVGLISDNHASGVVEGVYVYSRDSIGDLQRFMDNRQLTGQIREVFELLLKKTGR